MSHMLQREQLKPLEVGEPHWLHTKIACFLSVSVSSSVRPGAAGTTGLAFFCMRFCCRAPCRTGRAWPGHYWQRPATATSTLPATHLTKTAAAHRSVDAPGRGKICHVSLTSSFNYWLSIGLAAFPRTQAHEDGSRSTKLLCCLSFSPL